MFLNKSHIRCLLLCYHKLRICGRPPLVCRNVGIFPLGKTAPGPIWEPPQRLITAALPSNVLIWLPWLLFSDVLYRNVLYCIVLATANAVEVPPPLTSTHFDVVLIFIVVQYSVADKHQDPHSNLFTSLPLDGSVYLNASTAWFKQVIVSCQKGVWYLCFLASLYLVWSQRGMTYMSSNWAEWAKNI